MGAELPYHDNDLIGFAKSSLDCAFALPEPCDAAPVQSDPAAPIYQTEEAVLQQLAVRDAVWTVSSLQNSIPSPSIAKELTQGQAIKHSGRLIRLRKGQGVYTICSRVLRLLIRG